MSIWVAFDGLSNRIIGVSRDMSLSDLPPHQSRSIRWKPYGPVLSPEKEEGKPVHLLEHIKAILKQEADTFSEVDSRAKATEWLESWFGINKRPARQIAAHWSDEPDPEAK